MLSSCAAVIGNETFERSLDQKELKRVAFQRSKKRILLVDHTKFEAHATYRLTSLDQYDLVVSDAAPPQMENAENINFIY